MKLRNAVLLWATLASALGSVSAPAVAADVARGEYLLHAGGCISCHTDQKTLKAKGPVLGGGRELKTPFGVFYGPNITPHKEHGLGRWSEADFIRAMRHGRAPNGANYYPAFPYTSFSGMTDWDLRDLWAYLRTVKPVGKANRAHRLRFPFNVRFGLTFWKWLYFKPGVRAPAPGWSTTVARGAYVANALGHCAECHTPRSAMGGLRRDRWMAGAAGGPAGDAPNITPDKATGIGDWSADDIVSALKIGMLPDGDFVGGEMADVVAHGTSKLTDADLKAIAAYLKTLPPIKSARKKKK